MAAPRITPLYSTILSISCFGIIFLSYAFAHDEDHMMITQVSDGFNDINLQLGDPSIAQLISNSAVKAIYQFGDSIADTGNLMRDDPLCDSAKYPYGETFFNAPTGRCSDGLLIIDFLANFSGLPFLDAYLNRDGNFSQGVNFAVAGSSALDTPTLLEKYNLTATTNLSLSVQLDWFKSHLKTICPNALDCKRELSEALFVMGEIGGNDMNAAFTQGRPMPEVRKMVPDVLQAISSSVKEVINLGAKRIIMPGNFPCGCMTINLALLRTNDSTKYDELGCLKHLNRFAKYQNKQLRKTIERLKKDHPGVQIVYMDYYAALRHLLRHASSLGFDKDTIHKACCGIGDEDYNFDPSRWCGSEGVPVCENPHKLASWDGVHLTQHAYQVMANYLLMRDSSYGSSDVA